MRTLQRRLIVFLFLLPAWALPCTVPVFRYALERWAPDPHLVMLPRDLPREADAFSGYGDANLFLQPSPEDEDGADLVRVFFEESMIEWWRGPHAEGLWDRLADSPLRREIARQLLSGTSVVFVWIQSGTSPEDEALLAEVRRILKKMETELELPEQAEYDEDDPRGRHVSPLPLKLEFSLLTLDPGQAEEEFFRRQLLAVVEPKPEEGPVLAAIFGQGRVISLSKSLINVDSLEDLCMFLIGPCSCQVKALNPGHDLLMTAAWQAAVYEYPQAVSHALPSGKTFFFSDPAKAPEVREAEAAAPAPAPVPEEDPKKAWLLLGGLGLLVLLGGLRVFASRRH